LSAISHNPLLAALCRSITEVQIGLALKLFGASIEDWRRVVGSLQSARMEIVDAIAQRDCARAVQLVHDYHRKAIRSAQS
jgi:DNA-binding FadR family transcriptional regulator